MKVEAAAVAIYAFCALGCSSSDFQAKGVPGTKANVKRYDARNPKPIYDLTQGKIEGLPSFTIVNRVMKNYKFKREFPWHLNIVIAMKDMYPAQLPTRSEAKVLNDLEDKISASLAKVCHFHHIGRTTWKGERELFFYLDSPEAANKVLQSYTSAKKPIRQFRYEMSEDKTWSKGGFLFNYNTKPLPK